MPLYFLYLQQLDCWLNDCTCPRNWWTFVAEFQPRPAIIAGGLYYGGQWGVGRKPLFIIALFVTGLRCRSILLFPYLICILHMLIMTDMFFSFCLFAFFSRSLCPHVIHLSQWKTKMFSLFFNSRCLISDLL